MEYEEYQKILDRAVVNYANSGGSVYFLGLAQKEYFFEYDEEPIAEDTKKNLNYKAVKAIIAKEKLPKGVTLVDCVLHERKGKTGDY